MFVLRTERYLYKLYITFFCFIVIILQLYTNLMICCSTLWILMAPYNMMHRTCSYKTTYAVSFHQRALGTVLVTKVTLYGISGSLSWNYVHAAYFCCKLLSLVSRFTLSVHVRGCGKVVGSCASYFGGHGFDSWFSYRLSVLKSSFLVLMFSRLLLGYLFKNRPHSYTVRQ
jgi:hypothetical protein